MIHKTSGKIQGGVSRSRGALATVTAQSVGVLGGGYLTLGLGYEILTIPSHVQKIWHQDTAKNQTSKAGQLTSPDRGTKDIPSQLDPISSNWPKRLAGQLS